MPFPSISYPSPTSFNPAPNPAGFASDAATAYAAGLHFAQALKAANYQAALQRQQQIQQAQNAANVQARAASNQRANLMKGGATVLEEGAPTTVPGSQTQVGPQAQSKPPSLVQRIFHPGASRYADPSYQSQQPGATTLPGLKVRPGATAADPTDAAGDRIVQQPGGPPLGAEGQNTVALGQLNQALQEGGQPGIPTAVPGQPGGVVAPDDLSTHTGHRFVGLDGTVYHLPSLEEAAKARRAGLPDNTILPGQLAGAFVAAGGDPAQIDKALNSLDPKHPITPQIVGMLKSILPAPETQHIFDTGYDAPWAVGTRTLKTAPVPIPAGRTRTEKPDKFNYRYETDNAGRLNIIRTDKDGVPTILKQGQWVPLEGGEAVGPTRKDPNAISPTTQLLIDERAQNRAEAKATKGQAVVDKFQKTEDEAHRMRNLIAAALSAKPDENTGKTMIIDPTEKRGAGDTAKEVELTPSRRKALETAYNNYSEQAENNYKSKQKIIAAHGGEVGAPLKLDRWGQAVTTTTQPQQTNPTDPRRSYVKGAVYGGMEYLGGDPNNQSSWKKAR